MVDDPRAFLASRIPSEQLERGLRKLERLHARVRTLLHGCATRVLEHDDHGYAAYFLHRRTPALHAIAEDGWVERHVRDFALLVESPDLASCCRTTALELFGISAFHVAIQHYPVSDGLVRELCHGHWDRQLRIRRIAGELVYLRFAFGSYPPPGEGNDAVSSDSPIFPAIPVGGACPDWMYADE